MLAQAARELAIAFQREVARDGVKVTLHWVDEEDAAYDPVTGVMNSGVATPQSAEVRAMIHFVQPSQMILTDFVELEAGDCIADFPGDVAVDGKPHLTFEIAGQRWEQKKVSSRLLEHYDAIVGDVKVTRTIVLRKAT